MQDFRTKLKNSFLQGELWLSIMWPSMESVSMAAALTLSVLFIKT